MTSNQKTMQQLVRRSLQAFFVEEHKALAIDMLHVVGKAIFTQVELHWPNEDKWSTQVVKANEELAFQLQWQCKIFEMLTYVPTSQLIKLQIPRTPFSVDQVQAFTNLIKANQQQSAPRQHNPRFPCFPWGHRSIAPYRHRH